MASWEAQTTAQDIAEGAAIHLDKGNPPIAPVSGQKFVITNPDMAKTFATTIVSLGPGEIVFSWGGQDWKAVPLPEAAPSSFRDDQGQPLIPLKIELA